MKLYQSNPDKRCWRVAAIYRLALCRGLPKDWAMARMREIWPDGSRDGVVENWFIDLARLRGLRHARKLVAVSAGPAQAASSEQDRALRIAA